MRGDFAGGVSSNSSNLAWGGIKYLESREFLLVDKLCRSRNELMRAYPSTVREIRFFTTIQKGFRVWSVSSSRQRALLADRPLPYAGAALPVAADHRVPGTGDQHQ
jgi:glycerol-3-phosphate dehydrogenase